VASMIAPIDGFQIDFGVVKFTIDVLEHDSGYCRSVAPFLVPLS